MNHTSRMTALLGELRRERNGAVADAMRLVGAPYGLNYGVSLPTLRRLARAEKPDYAFAKFLSLQDVRELRLAAYHIADPAGLTPGEFPFWASGIVNHELAEEAAFALLPRIGDFPALFRTWTAAGPWALPPLRSLSHRGRWRCLRPSGPETGRAGRRCSAKPALWAGSVPKTTSTRSWPGGWKFSDVRRVRAVRSCRKPP